MEYLNQPISELLETNAAKVIAGIVLWYLTAAIWWTRSWASNLSDKKLQKGASDYEVGLAPIVFVFSVIAMPVWCLYKTWQGASILLLPPSVRKRHKELNG